MEKQSVFGTGSSEVVCKAAGHGLATEFLDIEPTLDRIKGYRYLPESSDTARGGGLTMSTWKVGW